MKYINIKNELHYNKEKRELMLSSLLYYNIWKQALLFDIVIKTENAFIMSANNYR